MILQFFNDYMKLPKAKAGYDGTLVIVNRYLQYV
jgi:hypothetical protein